MTEFTLVIEGRLEAKNLDSASRKKEAVKELLERKGIHAVYIHVRGEEQRR